MACVCVHRYPHAPCGCSEDCWQHCPTPDHIRSIRDENARLRSRIGELERVHADLAEKARRLLGVALTDAPDQGHRP